ncbi:aldose 1-epimerase family protein [Allorhizobium sonneratiae]|uniref:aldose 1-epimerase family protein n=1 Tax=Allorhizobium sonneratiae TaxID=2934936 RepID=UPI00237CE3AE|nr:aldose 1-epimerase family protein [Allorhizobium sonneratiae]
MIQNDHMTLEISAMGAEMQSLTLANGQSLLWNGDPAWWTGRSPILFPIVGKAPDDHITIDGRSYPMAQHGFARRRIFTCLENKRDACRHELRADAETRAVYPYDFSLIVEHRLVENSLTVKATVRNLGDRPMPYGIGFHPAFRLPLPGGEGKDHTITLDTGAEPALYRLESGLLGTAPRPSPFRKGALTIDPTLFEEDAMIFPDGAGQSLTYAADGAPSLSFRFENLPNLALWQKPGAPFLCIEPWHGMAAQQGKGADIVARPYTSELPAGAATDYAFSLTIDVQAGE